MHVVVWRVSPRGTVKEITRPVILDQEMFELGEAYFGPPANLGETWPAGRSVFEIRRLAGGGSKYMALDFIPTGSQRALTPR